MNDRDVETMNVDYTYCDYSSPACECNIPTTHTIWEARHTKVNGLLNQHMHRTNTNLPIPKSTTRSDTGSLEVNIVATAETVDRFGVLFFVLLTC
jgi:hypothetical protein